MPTIKLSAFGGMIPIQDSRLLPDNMAESATNTWLYSGDIEGMRTPIELFTCVNSNTRRVYRIPKQYTDQDHLADSYWLEFPYKEVDVVHSVVKADTYERYYWAYGQEPGGTLGPRYNTKARIASGSASYLLGIPTPVTAPTISTSPGTGTVTESRAYMYTWVSGFGEEGAPSPPTVANGKNGDTWTIGLTAPTTPYTTDRNLTKVRIYRTVTSSAGVATFFFVTELPIATTTFADTISDTVVSANDQLSSTTWTGPPTDLSGMQAMANGVLIGFRDNEIWFCEPYYPHAWPAIYTLVVDFKILGIGVVGQTAIICTEAATYACTGIDPAFMTLSKISTRDVCASRGSILSTPLGVFYATTKGVVMANPSQVIPVTEKLFSKDKWLNTFTVQTLRAAQLGSAYFLYGSVSAGCFQEDAFQNNAFERTDYTGSRSGGLIDMGDTRTAFSLMSDTTPMVNLYNDSWTNEILLLRGGKVYHLDVAGSAPRSEYTWRSKLFQATNLRNFEAMKIYFDNPEGLSNLGTIKIYADNRLVATKPLTKSGMMMRLPSGFKADFWQVEITSRVIISNVQMATSAKELKLV